MSYSPFGAQTDHFSILTTVLGEGTLADVLELVSSTKTIVPKAMAYAQDENGDNADGTVYGAPTTMYEASSTFAVKSGSFSLNLLKLGYIASTKAILSIEIPTENGGWPQLTVSGRLGCIDPASLKTYTLPDITIYGKKQAQVMGFTVAAGCKLTGSNLSASVEFSEQTDGMGVPVAQDVAGGVVTVTADFVGITAAPGWTVTHSGASELAAPGSEEPQAAYNTGSGTWEIMLAVDAA
jgi:hypothetical protein